MATQEQSTPSTAMLFTDALGHVVFADQRFVRLMSYTSAGKVAGEPLHKALGVEQKLTKQLLDELRAVGNIQDHRIDIPAAEGRTLKIAFSGVATYDDRGAYLGADLTLRDIKRATSEIKMTEHGDAIKASVQHMIDLSQPVKEIDHVAVYVKTVMDALHVLVGRLIGVKVGSQMDAAVNEKSAKQGWGVHYESGLFTLEGDAALLDCDIYCDMMNTAASFAADLIGGQVVRREVDLINANMEPMTLKAATDAGINLSL